jgi:anti-sigma factor RsiW
MQCPIQTNEDVLLDYCAGKLSPEATLTFERHMETCADCRMVANAQRSVWNDLDSLEAMPISADFDRKLYARIEQYENSSWWRKLWHRGALQPFSFGPAVPIATVGVTVFAAVMLYLPYGGPKVDTQAPSKIESSEIDQLERTLEDMEMLKQVAPAPASRS